ncbi:hypothetical protein FACS1894189_2760 [Planctomycetales bacterium]|nr:hypothetical protein FACS1894189_2760 [Planctomycetales bacterium]
MIIFSRNRNESAADTETAQFLAEKFDAEVWSIPFLYDLPASGQTVKRLQSLDESAIFVIPFSERAAKSLLTSWNIPFSVVFGYIDGHIDSLKVPNGGIIGGKVERLEEPITSRWYPVIDETACLSCLECVNFCLFGVYAIGKEDKPFVDQPDACRDGCPACSRVCPSKAIMFPLYDDPVIAGYTLSPKDELDDLVNIVDQLD